MIFINNDVLCEESAFHIYVHAYSAAIGRSYVCI